MIKAKIKKVLKLRLTIADHHALGHKLVPHWGQEHSDYQHDWGKYNIVEVCVGELKGHCWIERQK